MFDIMYEQTYTMKWKYLAALLDMFNPNIGQLPEDDIIDEMIEAEYILYNREQKVFRLSSNYRILVESFLGTNTAVNIEAPSVSKMNSSLSLYYLNNYRHMIVLIHKENVNEEDGIVEIAISNKNSSATILLEKLGCEFGKDVINVPTESFDPDNLPIMYKNDYELALKSSSLFRVTLYEQNHDASDGVIAVFAAFPANDSSIWMTAMRQKFTKKEKPVVVQKLSKKDYQEQLINFFKLFEKEIWK